MGGQRGSDIEKWFVVMKSWTGRSEGGISNTETGEKYTKKI